jgi:hypothetical protein
MTATPVDLRLSEGFVQDCFHSYLKSSLTQAKVERLVNAELLSSAEAYLMITGTFIHVRRIVALNGSMLSTRSCTVLVFCSSKMHDQPAICPSSKAEQGQPSRYGNRAIRDQLSYHLPLLPTGLGR